MPKPVKRQVPYHGASPDLRHYHFVRKSGLARWELEGWDRESILPTSGEVCLWTAVAAVLFAFLFWALGQGV